MKDEHGIRLHEDGLSDAAHLHTRRIDGCVTMWEDPIVAEVHRIREQLAGQFNFDVKAMFADMRKRQTALGSRLVSRYQSAEPAAEADRVRDAESGWPFVVRSGRILVEESPDDD